MELFNPDDMRYEKKFIIPEPKPYEIEHIIKSHPAMFSEINYHGRESNTNQNSIYLDSLNLRNYQEHINGVSPRLKIRIRWYKNIFGLIKKPRLEVKLKKNEIRNKLSFPLKPFILDKNLSLDHLQKEIFAKSNLPGWLLNELKLYRMVLLTSYKRKYFLSIDKKYRLTLDTEIKYFKIKDGNNLFLEKIEDYYSSVLEVKFSIKDYENVRYITEHFPFRLVANSKYINGIKLVEF